MAIHIFLVKKYLLTFSETFAGCGVSRNLVVVFISFMFHESPSCFSNHVEIQFLDQEIRLTSKSRFLNYEGIQFLDKEF